MRMDIGLLRGSFMQDKKALKQLVIVCVLLVIAGCSVVWVFIEFWPGWGHQSSFSDRPQVVAKAATAAPSSKPIQRTAPQDTVAVQPITSSAQAERTVYSGTLGEMTGLMAGRDMAKVAVELREYEQKIQELEQKTSPMPVIVPPESVSQLQSQGGVSSPSTTFDKGTQEGKRLVVMSVRGSQGALVATLRTRAGTYTVRTGDMVPGFGRVSTITKDRVVVGKTTVPWL